MFDMSNNRMHNLTMIKEILLNHHDFYWHKLGHIDLTQKKSIRDLILFRRELIRSFNQSIPQFRELYLERIYLSLGSFELYFERFPCRNCHFREMRKFHRIFYSLSEKNVDGNLKNKAKKYLKQTDARIDEMLVLNQRFFSRSLRKNQ